MRFHIHKFDKLPVSAPEKRYISAEYFSFRTDLGEAKVAILKCIKCPKLKWSLTWEDKK